MDKLKYIEQKVNNCKKCSLFEYRCKSVFGRGNSNAKIILVGEAPGQKENKTGLPFKGKSGTTLVNLLTEVGFNLDKDIYFCNVVKCRPTKGKRDRKPNKKEIDACKEYLFAQIKAINPKAIILCGTTASRTFGIKESLKKYFENTKNKDNKNYEGIPLFPIYHPRASITNDYKIKRLKHIKEMLNV